MRKLRSNKPLLFSMITAFLFLQWSATHIHLAGEHEHDGGHHQHTVTTHKHQLISHHTDAIDISSDILSHLDTNKIVELGYVCTKFHGNASKLFAVIPYAAGHNFETQLASNKAVTTYQQDNYLRYHQYSLIQLRAPPTTT